MAQPKEERTIEITVNGQKANASLKEMEAAAAVLNNQFRKMAADDPGRAKLIADFQSMKGKISQVKEEVAGVSQSAGLMKQAFTNAFALLTGGGIVALAGKLLGFFSDSREEYLQSAKSSADLEATLRSTAHAAGLTAAEIRKIGEARAKVTLFDDDETNRASAMLLTFTNIKKGVFEEAVPAIQDLATKMGGDGPADLKGASIQVGKALNDPVNGIKALTRIGVTFTEQQKDQIKAMVAAGDTAGAQRLILAELTKEFGGSAEAARKAGGGLATLSMRFNEMKETVGGKVMEVLNAFTNWLGRVLDGAQPLLDLISALADEFASYYQEIADIVESLGLFNEKTDTAKMVVEVLKGALTLLLFPVRMLLQLSKAVVDGFVDWYNKSEMLRGILGGLGAVIVSLFTTIKDDAVKLLSGVGDILIGIFTLDKAKIMAGFKSALAATADAALEGGARAASKFMEGYAGAKDNRIVHWMSIKTSETSTGGTPATGGDEPAGESEKDKKAREAAEKRAQAARDRADRARLEALKKQVAMEAALEDARILAINDKREREIAKINLDAKRKAAVVMGTEAEMTQQRLAINEERERRLQELSAKYQQQADTQHQADFEQDLADEEAAEVEREAAIQGRFEDALINEEARNQQLYNAKHASLEAELALAEAYGGKTGAAYRKTFKDLEKLEKDHHKTVIEDTKKREDAKHKMAQVGLSVAGDVLQTTIDLLFKDEAARKKHHNLYTALSGAKIIMDGVQEVAAIWRYSAENPFNGPTAGAAGAIMGGIQTALAVGRTIFGLTQLQAFKFAKGGATGTGEGLAVSPMGQLMQMSGMTVGGDGRLRDTTGFAVAGVVHEDEYVIPKWQLADPQVAAVAQWLEARRLRGFADGGATGAATLPPAAAAPETDGELSYAVLSQLLTEFRTLNQRLAGVETWQRELRVVNNLQDTRAGLDELKQVRYENGIRA